MGSFIYFYFHFHFRNSLSPIALIIDGTDRWHVHPLAAIGPLREIKPQRRNAMSMCEAVEARIASVARASERAESVDFAAVRLLGIGIVLTAVALWLTRGVSLTM
jgi:hypothetical protein